ncbi:ribbon-helix-helix domain-containing protein [Zavarzinia compransoris]|uniref:Type II toxin-antitoxin system ParD family antitoxin n=1 Tax=Zavarzinia compransoris TaxID=1264899 RepID=A0A317E5E2_9PROT|nr:ribbon-helix-helix domain-containing protein [Zavarzinia compransoris]PWR22287.1 type II toxin-antitoxin system ParD family antitoxin [Zavarzinia compransoris]TDP46950.1 antitoxin ParD1/3/4 [Zavarzinia compransoris]
MRRTQALSITLPVEMAAALDRQVKSGAYASVSEVVRAALRAHLAREDSFQTWLRTEGAAAHDAYRDRPDDLHTSNEVAAAIDAARTDDRAE